MNSNLDGDVYLNKFFIITREFHGIGDASAFTICPSDFISNAETPDPSVQLARGSTRLEFCSHQNSSLVRTHHHPKGLNLRYVRLI